MARRSLRKRNRVSYYDFVDSSVATDSLENEKEEDQMKRPVQEKEGVLAKQMEKLLKQREILHNLVDEHVGEVKSTAKDWMEENLPRNLRFENVQQIVSQTVALITESCIDLASWNQRKLSSLAVDEKIDNKSNAERLQNNTGHEDSGCEDVELKGNERLHEVQDTPTTKQMRQSKSSNSGDGNGKSKYLSCDICQKQFSSTSKFSAHRRRHSYKFQFKCNKCDRTFQFQSQLDRHHLSHTGEKAFKCERCGKLFQGRQGLEKHQEKHLPVKPEYKCDVCGKILGSKNYLQRHKRVHSTENPFRCHICAKACIDSKTLNEHIMTHTDEKPYTCDICKHSFKRKSYLSQHIKCVHRRESQYKCDGCGKKFVDKWYLSVHKQLHKPDTPYLCDFCGKAYKNKYTLKSHKLTHIDRDPFICDVCGKGFKIKGGLKEHKKSHSDEKPHSCDICGRAFKDRNQLASHKWIHVEERPFKCDICNKSFPWKGRLDLHKRTHSTERPFGCNVCGKSFKRKHDISKHKMKVHERKKCGHVSSFHHQEPQQHLYNGKANHLYESTQPNIIVESHDVPLRSHYGGKTPVEICDSDMLLTKERNTSAFEINSSSTHVGLKTVEKLSSSRLNVPLNGLNSSDLQTDLQYEGTIQEINYSTEGQATNGQDYGNSYVVVYGNQEPQTSVFSESVPQTGRPGSSDIHTAQLSCQQLQPRFSMSESQNSTNFLPIEHAACQPSVDGQISQNALYTGLPIPYPWNTMCQEKY